MAKTFRSAITLVASLLISATCARADIYSFNAGGFGFVGSGTFEASLTGIGNTLQSSPAGFYNFTGTSGYIGQQFPILSGGGSINSGVGNINFSNGSTSFFVNGFAVTSDSSPSSFSFGGGGYLVSATNISPSGGGSGGVPSPEVNAGLGMLLAGATFVFLRRRRGARHEVTAA